MRILLDTNIVLRHAHQVDPQHDLVRDAVDRLFEGKWDPRVCDQNIYEFWVVATRAVESNGFGMPAEDARGEAERIAVTFAILPDPSELRQRWLDLCAREGVLGRTAYDARLVALMIAHGITHVLTLNPGDFRRYSEITVLTPADVLAMPLAPPETDDVPSNQS